MDEALRCEMLCGDGPLIRSKTLQILTEKHAAEQAAVTLATAVLEDPTGYGTLKEVLGEKDMAAFKKRWQAWVLKLRFSSR